MFSNAEQYSEALSYLVNHEPCLQRTLTLVDDILFYNDPDLVISYQSPSPTFKRFFRDHFIPIARQVVKYNLYCGFVPWAKNTLPSGEVVPVILPMGTFSWDVKVRNMESKKRKTVDGYEAADISGRNKSVGNVYLSQTSLLQYIVHVVQPMGIDNNEIIVCSTTEPSLPLLSNMSSTSSLNTLANSSSSRFRNRVFLFSPLTSVVHSYCTLERAMHRRAYADDWNTTARIVTSNAPPRMNTDAPSMDMLDSLAGTGSATMGHLAGSYTYDNMQLRFSPYDTVVSNILTKDTGSVGEHCPAVYTLPQHYKIEKLDTLTPVEDVVQLTGDFQRSISQVTGIPLALVQNFESHAGLGASEDPVLMNTLVMLTCKRATKMIEKVLTEMYMHIYHPTTPLSIASQKFMMRFKLKALVEPEEQGGTASKSASTPAKKKKPQ